MKANSQFRRNYNPPNFVDKRALQDELDQQVRQFLENGGTIQRIPSGLSVGHSRITRANRQVNPAEIFGAGEING